MYIEIIALFLGVVCLLTFLNFLRIRVQQWKVSNNLQIDKLIQYSKISLDKALCDKSKANCGLDDSYRAIHPLVEDYFNALNTGCCMYLNNRLNENMFKEQYKEDIFNIQKGIFETYYLEGNYPHIKAFCAIVK